MTYCRFPSSPAPKETFSIVSVLRDGNPKTEDVGGERGLTHALNHCQESGASHQRRMEYVPYEVSSICTGDQKPVLDLHFCKIWLNQPIQLPNHQLRGAEGQQSATSQRQ